MKIILTANRDDYDATEVHVVVSRTETEALIWLEVAGHKVSINKRDLMSAIKSLE